MGFRWELARNYQRRKRYNKSIIKGMLANKTTPEEAR